MVKTYNTSKSNTSSEAHGGGGGGPDKAQGTDYSVVDESGRVRVNSDFGDGEALDKASRAVRKTEEYAGPGMGSHHPSHPGEEVVISDQGSGGDSGAVDHNSTRSNNGIDGGGGGPDPAQGTDYHTTRSNTSSATPRDKHTGRATGKRNSVDGNGGGGGSEKSGAIDHNSTRSNRGASVGEESKGLNAVNVKTTSIGSGGGTGVIGSTLGIAKTVIMAAILLTAAGVGFDLYQTYNDAINLNLEDHVTDADFALNDDKTEINGDIGFNIPEMGMFEKKILAKVHVTVLESNPTTDGDYSFKHTLGSGEHTYKFSLTDLDPVTVEKIDAGEDLELEYTTSITVIYLGVELAPATTDMPAKTVTVETA